MSGSSIPRDLARRVRLLIRNNERMKSLEQNEERYRATFEQAAIGIAHVAPDGHFLRANRKFCQIFGSSQAQVLARSLQDILETKTPPTNSGDSLRDLAYTASVGPVEANCKRFAGDPVPVSLRMSLVRKVSGRPAYYILFIEDITARRQAEVSLRESEHRLEMALERPDLGMWDHNIQTGQVIFSDRYFTMLGYGPDEVDSTEDMWRSLIHPDDSRMVLSKFDDYLEGRADEYHAQYRLRAKSGEYRHVLSSGKIFERDQQGRPVWVLGTHLDITDYKQIEASLQKAQAELEKRVEERTAALKTANEQLLQEIQERGRIETALRESEARFRNLFENSPLCVFEVDIAAPTPNILQANHQVEQVYGWTADELSSAALSRIFLSRKTLDRIHALSGQKQQQVLCLETISQRRDGSRFPARVSAAVSPARGSSRAILAVEDISVEKDRRSEEESIAEERRRIAREIHDGFAQDLASLRLKARLWKDLLERDPAKMQEELDSLREILDKNIRDVRRSIFSLRPLALDDLGFFGALDQFIREFGEQNQLHIQLCVSGPEDYLPSNLELLLFRIIQEALNNTSKHAGAGQVVIELKLDVADSVLFLRVQDDGAGFVPEEVPVDYSIQSEHLGLRHMQERVESLGGTFVLMSWPGIGTEIQITMPLRSPKGS